MISEKNYIKKRGALPECMFLEEKNVILGWAQALAPWYLSGLSGGISGPYPTGD